MSSGARKAAVAADDGMPGQAGEENFPSSLSQSLSLFFIVVGCFAAVS